MASTEAAPLMEEPVSTGQQAQNNPANDAVSDTIRSFDAYPKYRPEVLVKTKLGGALSLAMWVIIGLLVVWEASRYFERQNVTEAAVDHSIGDRIDLFVDVTVHHIPCSLLSMDIMDASGHKQHNVHRRVYMTRLKPDGTTVNEDESIEKWIESLTKKGKSSGQISGLLRKWKSVISHEKILQEMVKGQEAMGSDDVALTLFEQGLDFEGETGSDSYCGSCFGAESDEFRCCNTCDEVKKAYKAQGWDVNPSDLPNVHQCRRESFFESIKSQRDEGCRVLGVLTLDKAAGLLHVGVGKGFDLQSEHHKDLVLKHLSDHIYTRNVKAKTLSFSDLHFDVSHTINYLSFGKKAPGQVDPLDHHVQTSLGYGAHSYFFRVVPVATRDERKSGRTTYAHEYAVHERFERRLVPGMPGGLPGIYMYFDMSPIQIIHSKRWSKTMLHFVVQIFAIIGGVFAMARFIDSVVYSIKAR